MIVKNVCDILYKQHNLDVLEGLTEKKTRETIQHHKTVETVAEQVLLCLVPVQAGLVWPQWSSLHAPSHFCREQQNNLTTHSSEHSWHHDN